MSGFLLIGKNICPHKSLGHQFVILCAPGRWSHWAAPSTSTPHPLTIQRPGWQRCLHTARWGQMGRGSHDTSELDTNTPIICRSLRVPRGRIFFEIAGLSKVEQFSVLRDLGRVQEGGAANWRPVWWSVRRGRVRSVHGSVSPAARLHPKFLMILTLPDSPDTLSSSSSPPCGWIGAQQTSRYTI